MSTWTTIRNELIKRLLKYLGVELDKPVSQPAGDTTPVSQPDGDATLDSKIDESAATAETEAASSADADAVAYSDLNWDYGGFKGGKAALVDGCEISGLSVGKDKMSYKWAKGGCEKLGASDPGDASITLACLFFYIGGKWVGGKFDWISTSRTSRSFENIRGGYNGWKTDAPEVATGAAFVIVSSDGKKRTNVIKG